MKRFIVLNMETDTGYACPVPTVERYAYPAYIYTSQEVAQKQAEALARCGAGHTFVVFELIPRTINRLPAPVPSITTIVQPGQEV